MYNTGHFYWYQNCRGSLFIALTSYWFPKVFGYYLSRHLFKYLGGKFCEKLVESGSYIESGYNLNKAAYPPEISYVAMLYFGQNHH